MKQNSTREKENIIAKSAFKVIEKKKLPWMFS